MISVLLGPLGFHVVPPRRVCLLPAGQTKARMVAPWVTIRKFSSPGTALEMVKLTFPVALLRLIKTAFPRLMSSAAVMPVGAVTVCTSAPRPPFAPGRTPTTPLVRSTNPQSGELFSPPWLVRTLDLAVLLGRR